MAALTSLWLILPQLIQTWYTVELLGMLAAATILVLSLYRLKKQIRQLGQTEVKAREKLMCAHTAMFICYIALAAV